MAVGEAKSSCVLPFLRPGAGAFTRSFKNKSLQSCAGITCRREHDWARGVSGEWRLVRDAVPARVGSSLWGRAELQLDVPAFLQNPSRIQPANIATPKSYADNWIPINHCGSIIYEENTGKLLILKASETQKSCTLYAYTIQFSRNQQTNRGSPFAPPERKRR